MTLKFSYHRFRSPRPIWTLQNSLFRPRPTIFVTVKGPGGAWNELGLVDTGSDDTVFPGYVARIIGLDLTQAPTRTASGVGKVPAVIHLAEVILKITDGREIREWPARDGFTSTPLKSPLLGFAGFLQYFSANFQGDQEVLELTVNSLYPGT